MKPRTVEEFKWPYIGTRTARAELFANGIRMKFSTSKIPNPDALPPDTRRGDIRDQSSISRMRCAFAMGNAWNHSAGRKVNWHAMSTLTWREAPESEEVKGAVDALRRAYRSRWGESPCGWVMEMQERGVPHFHMVHAEESAFGQACCGARTELVMRGPDGETETEIVRGGPDYWLVDTWLSIIGAADDARSVAFNRGGIIERFRNPAGAGMYFAKEASKREQKVLPERYSKGLGRWWLLNARWKIHPLAWLDINLEHWPWDWPVKHVWDAAAIAGAISAVSVLPGFPNAAHVAATAAETFPLTQDEIMRPAREAQDALDASREAERQAALAVPDWARAYKRKQCLCGGLMWLVGDVWGCDRCARTQFRSVREHQTEIPF